MRWKDRLTKFLMQFLLRFFGLIPEGSHYVSRDSRPAVVRSQRDRIIF